MSAQPLNLTALSPSEQAELIQRLEARNQYEAANDEERRKLQYRASLEADFSSFVKAAWPVIRPGIQLSWSWHYDLIAEHLTMVYQRKTRRLIINISPRTLKSILISVMFPVWVWTKRPTHNFACASYSEKLSTEHSVMRRDIIESEWFQAYWGDKVWLADDQNQKTKYKNNHQAQMLATSVDGTATGLGGNTLILDDGMNPKQAASEAQSKTARDWFDNTWSNRLNEPAEDSLVIVEQRTGELDITGHCLMTDKDGWTHISIPLEAEEKKVDGKMVPERHIFPISGRVVIREKGDVLQPDRFTPAVVAGLKKLRLVWSSQYQQHPAPLEGNMIKRKDVQYFGGIDPETGKRDRELPDSFDVVLISADCTFKDLTSSDYVAIGAIGAKGPDRFVLELVLKHLDLPATVKAVKDMRLRWRSNLIVVEDKANGPAVIKELRRKLAGVKAVNPQGGKVSRMVAVCGEWQTGNWYVDRNAAWCDPFVESITKFPSHIYDDDTDMMTQAGIELQQRHFEFGLLKFYANTEAEIMAKRHGKLNNSELLAKIRKGEEGFVPEPEKDAERVDQAAPVILSRDIVKVDVPDNVDRCPSCSSVLVQRVAGGKRCGNCGAQWNQPSINKVPSGVVRK